MQHGAEPNRFCLGEVGPCVLRTSIAGSVVVNATASMLRVLLRHGADPDMPVDPDNAMSPLGLLLAGYVDPTATDSPLALVPVRCVEALLEGGANPWLYYGAGGESVLHIAVSKLPVPLLRKVLQAAVAVVARQQEAAAGGRSSDLQAAFVQRLCQPQPTTVETLMPDGDVWSAATARRLSIDSDRPCATILHAVYTRPETDEYLEFDLHADCVVQLLLEFGAGACVDSTTPELGAPFYHSAVQSLHTHAMKPRCFHQFDPQLGVIGGH